MTMSSGVVSLKFVYSPRVSFTGSPRASTSDASSVTSSFSAAALAKPARSSSTRTTCGVWISHSFERCSVLPTNWPSALSLIVALHGTASTAAPCSAASAMTSSTLRTETSGRAESCTQMSGASSPTSARPFATESCRSLPGSANASRSPCAALCGATSGRYCSSSTSTTFVMLGIPRKSSSECIITGFPTRSSSCFGLSAFIREPTPPASTIAAARGAGTVPLAIGALRAGAPAGGRSCDARNCDAPCDLDAASAQIVSVITTAMSHLN
mmetsp:Transcript_5546/g.17403  ORF Transcript_5546/g.17403 Transcript_5546/m.17403 type:complete len:270 (-) Transcript_5546:1-810(-)